MVVNGEFRFVHATGGARPGCFGGGLWGGGLESVARGTAPASVGADPIRRRGTMRAAMVGATKFAELFAGGGVADQHPHSGFGTLRQLSLWRWPVIGQQLFAAIVLQQAQAFGLEVGAHGLLPRVTPANAWTRKARQNRIDTGRRSRGKLSYSTLARGWKCGGGPEDGIAPPSGDRPRRMRFHLRA